MTEIRPFAADMAADCAALMHLSVHGGASSHYSKEELLAWSPQPASPEALAGRLAGQFAVTGWQAGALVGFMSMRPDGVIDTGYVLPHVRGTGVADALLAAIVHHAHEAGLKRLSTEASRPARSFFRRHGWNVLRPNIVMRSGQRLENFAMTFDL